MRYTSYINNIKATEWGLDIKLAYLFSWFYELPSWADKIIIGSDCYYFASKNKAIEELSLLTNKRDTMYRYYKKLQDLGLIKIKLIDNKDYICLTEKAKEWNGLKSEQSEKNPSRVGKKSEQGSEKNPTYNYNNYYNKIIDNNSSKDELENKKFTTYHFKKVLEELGAKKIHIEDWIKVRKNKKASNTETALRKFINECSKHNYPVSSAVEKCAENSWSGFKYEWIENQNNKQNEKSNERKFSRQTEADIRANLSGWEGL